MIMIIDGHTIIMRRLTGGKPRVLMIRVESGCMVPYLDMYVLSLPLGCDFLARPRSLWALNMRVRVYHAFSPRLRRKRA